MVLAEAEAKVSRGEEISDGERNALGRRHFSFLRAYENVWYQAKTGVLDPILYEGYLQGMRITLSSPLAFRLWNTYRKGPFFHPEFVEAMDEFLAHNPPITPVSMTDEGEEAQ